MPELVLVSGHGNLFPLELAGFETVESDGCRVPVVRHQDDEAQRFGTVGQQSFHVVHRSLHQFLAEGRVRLERAGDCLELQERSKIEMGHQ